MGNKNSLALTLIIILLIIVVGVAGFTYFIMQSKKDNKKETGPAPSGIIEISEDNSLVDTFVDSLYTALDELPEEYSINDAISDFCFIGLTNKTYNRTLVDDFIKSINENNPDKLRIVYETLEGDLIIKDISFDTKRFVVSIDMTRDQYAAVENRSIFMKEYSIDDYELVNTIEEEEGEQYRVVYLRSRGPIEETIRLFRYNILSENYDANGVQTFYGKIIKSSKNSIQVRPNDEYIEELSDRIEIPLEEDNKTVYELGTSVKIKYSGYVYDTNPPTIDLISLQFTKDSFVISFENTNSVSPEMVSRKEDSGYEYDVYQYAGKTYITIGEGDRVELSDAIKNGDITIEKIMESLKDEVDLGIVECQDLGDGGSSIYKLDEITVLIINDFEGNRGIYFGNEKLEKNDIIK